MPVRNAVEHTGVVTDEGPFDPATVGLAGALGAAVGATVTLYFPIGADLPECRRNTIDGYLSDLVGLCETPRDPNRGARFRRAIERWLF